MTLISSVDLKYETMLSQQFAHLTVRYLVTQIKSMDETDILVVQGRWCHLCDMSPAYINTGAFH